MPTKETPTASRGFTLKAIIICDEIEFADAAGTLLQRVGRRKGIHAIWEIKSWLVSAMNERALSEIAIVESLDAHLILLPAWLAHRFPQWLRHWLQRWAAARQIEKAAVGVIRLGGVDDGPYTELNKFVSLHELQFVAEGNDAFDVSRTPPITLAVQAAPFFRAHLPFTYSAALESFRGLGINE